jgi:hypothetical protein
VDIIWPPFPPNGFVSGRPATEEDIAADRAAFVLRAPTGELVGTPRVLALPRLGFSEVSGERQLVVAIQAEESQGKLVLGLRNADGSYSICSGAEFESCPRSLVLFPRSDFGLDQAEQALRKTRLTMARQHEVLAVRWKDGPVLFVRYAVGEAVAKEAELIGADTPHAAALARCDAEFEITFEDLDAVLDESVSLIDAQPLLEKATRGFLYNTWNGHLSAPRK